MDRFEMERATQKLRSLEDELMLKMSEREPDDLSLPPKTKLQALAGLEVDKVEEVVDRTELRVEKTVEKTPHHVMPGTVEAELTQFVNCVKTLRGELGITTDSAVDVAKFLMNRAQW